MLLICRRHDKRYSRVYVLRTCGRGEGESDKEKFALRDGRKEGERGEALPTPTPPDVSKM